VDLKAHAAPLDLEKVNENRVGADSEIAPVYSEKFNENGVGADWLFVNETTSKGDPWIRQCP